MLSPYKMTGDQNRNKELDKLELILEKLYE
jgi:hypothetical protein